MSFYITFGNHIKALLFAIMGTSMMIITLYFLEFDPDMLRVFLIFWLVYTIPAVYLHIRYYLQNRYHRIEITEDKILLREKTGNVVSYKAQDLAKIILCKSASTIQYTPMESYHFARIVAKNGQEIVFTCLMAPDVEKTVRILKGVQIEKNHRPFSNFFS